MKLRTTLNQNVLEQGKNRGIVIGTSEETTPFLLDLIKSIKTDYPIYICKAGTDRPINSYEIGSIKKGKELFDEFIFLQDTTLIKDNSMFDVLFATEGHVFVTEGCYHYMGKYISKELPTLPDVRSKDEAIHHELLWLKGSVIDKPLPVHTKIFEEKFGKTRMRLESEYMIKWKGTYYI